MLIYDCLKYARDPIVERIGNGLSPGRRVFVKNVDDRTLAGRLCVRVEPAIIAVAIRCKRVQPLPIGLVADGIAEQRSLRRKSFCSEDLDDRLARVAVRERKFDS